MQRLINIIRSKTFLIIFGILLLCIIIVIVALLGIFDEDTPKKAVYVILSQFSSQELY